MSVRGRVNNRLTSLSKERRKVIKMFQFNSLIVFFIKNAFNTWRRPIYDHRHINPQPVKACSTLSRRDADIRYRYADLFPFVFFIGAEDHGVCIIERGPNLVPVICLLFVSMTVVSILSVRKRRNKQIF